MPAPPSLPSRRDLVRTGILSALGLSLPNLLHAEQARANRRREKHCIFIYQYGGLSQLDSWDPKPHAPAVLRGPYKPIATAVPGLRVGELMPRLARHADKFAVIRSMTHSVPVHDLANKMLLAGRRTPAGDDPAFGSVIAKLKPSVARVPDYVWLQKFGGGAAPPDPAYLTGGALGAAHAPLLVGNSHDDNLATPGYKVRAFEGVGEMPPARIAGRCELLSRLDGNNPLAPHRAKAFDLITGPAAQKAFDIEQEPLKVRERYGLNPLGQNLLLARRLVEAGVRLTSVVAWTGLKPREKFMSVETWDMHGNAGVDIFGDGWNGLGFALPRCDQAVAALIEDLSDRGLLDDTLVVLIGEFGRTPRISKGATGVNGRDHWPNCYSAMLAGAGVRGGAVYGASDSTAAYVKDDPVSLEDFSATLYTALGVDPATRLSPDGFTRPVSTGEPISALLESRG
ncbi:DUF1501 domain-containing protein [Gemmata sp. JC717]|uniref:DUF1501 domain-containing protein n=1 Tax=Gemmata algarum TaxID=2975278 RepID=UPI0021BA4FBA|nr:DUF1501 domain-containing protein [Gemmata algarum]MDY3556924.1 DUF1501 domain-containing protein [Gemmata algarum]